MNRRELNDLYSRRAQMVANMTAAYDAHNEQEYTNLRNQVENINREIENAEFIVSQQEMNRTPASVAEVRDMAEERGRQLAAGETVVWDAAELRPVINSTLVGSGTLVEPVGAGTTIHDPVASFVPSIVDRVRVQDMTGLSGWQEPYVISAQAAKAGAVATLAGTTREATDPSFGVAEIKPYEVNITSYVDRNIQRLSPAAYYNKVADMALSALRRKVAELIVKGDGNVSPVMFGIKTAKNKAGAAIPATVRANAVDVNLLDTLYFAYGSDDAIGANATLILSKADLKALGALRGTNEKQRLFTITPNPGNPNTGMITDGGVTVPYIISSDVDALSGHTATSTAKITMMYGDPTNYLLGLFGGYSVRVSEDYKAAERLLTIMGDVFVGGNVVVDKGFVLAESKT